MSEDMTGKAGVYYSPSSSSFQQMKWKKTARRFNSASNSSKKPICTLDSVEIPEKRY